MKASGGILLLCALAVTALSCGGGSEGQSLPTRTAPTAPGPPAQAHRARVRVVSVPGRLPGAYVPGDRIVLRTAQDREARVEGTPRLQIKMGTGVRLAAFLPWDGDEWPPERLQLQHQFVYDVQPGDQDEDGISIGADALDFTDGAFLNGDGVAVGVEIYSVGPREGHFVEPGVDLDEHRVVGMAPPPPPVLPAHVSVYSIPSPYSGNYTEGMWIRLIAQFDEPVRITGNPRLAIGIGEDTRYADATPDLGIRYSGPDHKARRDTLLRFDYLIQADDLDRTGISIDADAFDFAGGRIAGRGSPEINVEIASVVPTETVSSDRGANPRRRWLPPIEPGLDIPEHPVAGRPQPRVCTDERQRALGRQPILVEEWDGSPFSFYFSLAGTPEHLRAEADRILEAAERLSERIEDQLGYPIFKVEGLLEDPSAEYPIRGRHCPWRKPGQIVGMYWESAQANYQCATWAGSLTFANGSVAHNTFHLFGFDHSPNDWRGEHDYWKGNWMSLRLTGVYVDDEDPGVTFEDVDALRCIFPKGG